VVVAMADYRRSPPGSLLGRVNADGSRELTFAGFADGPINKIVLQGDNGVLLAGDFSRVNGQTARGLARLSADGSLDNSFNAGLDGSVDLVALSPDGRIFISGWFQHVGEVMRPRLARLHGCRRRNCLCRWRTWGTLVYRPDHRQPAR
jgi:hypothetical protein